MARHQRFEMPEGLTPLEKALVTLIHQMSSDVIVEIRAFRWQALVLIVFLVGIISLLKGVNPSDAAVVVPGLLSPAAAESPRGEVTETPPPGPSFDPLGEAVLEE